MTKLYYCNRKRSSPRCTHLYQVQIFSSTGLRRPCPNCPEQGKKCKSLFNVKPNFFRYGRILSLHSLYLTSSQLTVGSSILLTRTTRCLTPAVLANMACSLVCPPLSKPVSNSPCVRISRAQRGQPERRHLSC